MKNKSPLINFEDNWQTTLGAFFPGERVVIHGKDLFHEFKNKSWMNLLLYTITGREFSKNQAKLFENIWTICTSYSDPRIWNNRVSSLSGSSRSTASLAVGASTAMSEAKIYGRRPDIRIATFLIYLHEAIERGQNINTYVDEYLKKYRGIPGYARPIINSDERIKPLMQVVEELGFENGEYLSLAFEIEKYLLASRKRMKANIAAITAALAIDQGLTPREYYHYAIASFTIGFLGCYVDAIEHPEGAFFPLPCERIAYSGIKHREW